MSMLGKTLAHYEIGDSLGEGGSGIVYRGRDLRLERQVAIKVLTNDLRDDELAWGRLLREARLASQLNHPHIAAVYDLGEEDGQAYIVMEYVEGMPLADLICDGGMPAEQVGHYAIQIAEALTYAHQRGVIHGDLKGSNIIVTPEGNAKLLDFGLGRCIARNGMKEITSSRLPLAEIGATGGTLPYLAPEVLRGGPPNIQSDAWAVGVLLYQMVTGELPFRGATPFDLSLEIMVGAPEKLGKIPEPLRTTLSRCLEKNPPHRLARLEEVASALKETTSSGNPAPPDEVNSAVGAPPALPAAHYSHKWWWAGGATALFAIALTGTYARHAWELRHAAAQPVEPVKVINSSELGNPQVKVWVNTRSGTYHCPGTRWYGKTAEGEYMTQKAAQDKGYHAVASRMCM